MNKDLLRTIVYVDGFNFYYGQLKGTPWKWLDLPLLFKNILGPQNGIVKVKYFTAKVQPTLSDPQVNIRQDSYFRGDSLHTRHNYSKAISMVIFQK